MEKTIQITLSQLEALLKEQKTICAKRIGNESNEDYQNIVEACRYLINGAPTPDLSHLVKNDVTNEAEGQQLTECYVPVSVEKGLPKGRYIVKGSNPNHLIEAYWSGEEWYLSDSDEDVIISESVTHYLKRK
jgi:hypothetical protein